jgi:hypothetical protein
MRRCGISRRLSRSIPASRRARRSSSGPGSRVPAREGWAPRPYGVSLEVAHQQAQQVEGGNVCSLVTLALDDLGHQSMSRRRRTEGAARLVCRMGAG